MALQRLLGQRFYLKLQIHNKYTIALIANIQNYNFFILLKHKNQNIDLILNTIKYYFFFRHLFATK